PHDPQAHKKLDALPRRRLDCDPAQALIRGRLGEHLRLQLFLGIPIALQSAEEIRGFHGFELLGSRPLELAHRVLRQIRQESDSAERWMDVVVQTRRDGTNVDGEPRPDYTLAKFDSPEQTKALVLFATELIGEAERGGEAALVDASQNEALEKCLPPLLFRYAVRPDLAFGHRHDHTTSRRSRRHYVSLRCGRLVSADARHP